MGFWEINLGAAAEAVGDFFGDVADGVQDTAEAAWDAATNVAEDFVDTATEVIEDVADATGEFLEGASKAASELIEDGIVLAGEFAKATGDFLVDASDWVVDTGEAVIGAVGWAIGAASAQIVDQAMMVPELIELRQRAMAANQGEPAQRRHDTPEDAKDFHDLSMAIYDSSQPLPEGYVEVENAEEELGIPLRDPETGLEAKVYKKDDTYVLVFEGTQSEDNGVDWGANVANGTGGVPKQYRQALDIALRFNDVYGERGDTVVTGHSLGGGLATFAGVGAGIETYTYNPSGLGPGTKLFLDSAGLIDRNEHLVKNYLQNGDILDLLRMGQTGLMPGAVLVTGGSFNLVGETERIGEWGRDPIDSHNNMDIEDVA